MASKRVAGFFILPTVRETSDAVLGMWEMECPEECPCVALPDLQAPKLSNRPDDAHDRDRVASFQYELPSS